jgi:predicted anti-sigma-YlaC factor YlaD
VAMIRARVAVEAPPATAMNCEDARDGLSALVRGPIALTDLALLEAHLKQCAPCRQAEARLRQLAAASHPVTPSRAVLASLRKAMELARIGATCSTALVVRRRALPTAAARELMPRAAGVMRAVGLAVGRSGDLRVRIRASLASAHAVAMRPIASALEVVVNALEAVRRTITRSVKRTIRFRPSVQAVGVVLALAFTLCALQGTDGPQQLTRPPAPPPPGLELTRLEPAQVESAQLEPTRLEPAQPEPVPAEAERVQAKPAQAEPAQLAPSLPAPPAEKKTVSSAPPGTDERRRAPSESPPRGAALSPPDVSASEPVRELASSPPTLLSEPPVSAAHVVGRLSAKNPRVARRDFIALLADVGGTELGRSQRVSFTTVEVVVPQSRYNEFADGLARIGSWRLEAARFPLPDAVHMTIRVTE